MGWPKGLKRKNYVKKDGSPHQPRRTHSTAIGTKADGTQNSEQVSIVNGKRRSRPMIVGTSMPISPYSAPTETPTVPSLHGASFRPVIETCPNCNYAYADGGYCPECGWSKPVVIGRIY